MNKFKSIYDIQKTESIGEVDIEGNDIKVNDIVEYYFDEHLGYSRVGSKDHTLMRDVVKKDAGRVFFMCRHGGAYPWRSLKCCRVVGNIIDHPDLVDSGKDEVNDD